ncbi:uncharacterized protein LOC115451968 isoform X2 [Manduca sexta]|uniref:Knottins-like domain-containing protein n=1 Tax=Manduca sexta TaxID=7130 RepID=A0A921ZRG0_MANSE|nr:uncharacterized protein LOC115451968 isoform X2 [Manduca sexta]KAG6462882.1 hypothetical protein O3G_MSEX013519 [Manduca sexta]
MQFSAIILLVSICVVNASVIINIYDDNHGETKSVEDCNFQACDQLCRNLGFPGGACVGDRCDCDNFKPHHSYNHKVSVPVEDCNFQACDQLCRNLGFPGGACVGDRCDCDNFKPQIEECNSQVCDQLCRWLGYPSGTCDDDHCNCNDYLQLNSKNHKVSHSSKDNEMSLTVKDCNFQACDQLCRRLGFPGGACVGDKCECDNFKPHSIPDHHRIRKLFTCDTVICDEMCHRLNFAGGMCEGGNCQCY